MFATAFIGGGCGAACENILAGYVEVPPAVIGLVIPDAKADPATIALCSRLLRRVLTIKAAKRPITSIAPTTAPTTMPTMAPVEREFFFEGPRSYLYVKRWVVITLTAGRRGFRVLRTTDGKVGVNRARERALMLRVVVGARVRGVVEKQGVCPASSVE